MITENMTLDTARDADFWAGEMLENTDHSDGDYSKLSDWIWNNKPIIGCTLDDHPINSMSTEEMFDILD